jgi:signal peptidase II
VAFWVTALLTLGLDQIAKMAVRARLVEGESLALISGIFHLTYVRNTGAAFGLLPGYQPVFMITSCVVLIAIAAYWRRSRPTAWPVVIALGLITGGASATSSTRRLSASHRHVDFLIVDFPVFNVADSAIVIGWRYSMLWLLFVPSPRVRPEPIR